MSMPGSRWRAKCHDRAGSFTIKERSVERDGERFVAEVRWSCSFKVEVAEVGPDGARGVDVPTVVVGDDGKLAWNPAIDAMGVDGAREGVAALQGLAPWCLEDFRRVLRRVATPDDLTRRETALPALRRAAHHGMPTGGQE